MLRVGFLFLEVHKQMIQIFFRMPAGNHITIDVHDGSESMLGLKKRLFQRTNLPSTLQRYVYNGRQILDDATVASLGILHGSTIHVLVRWHGLGCGCNLCDRCILLRSGARILREASFNTVEGGVRAKFLQDVLAIQCGQQPHACATTDHV